DRQIITGSWDNTIKVWNLQGELLKTIVAGKKRIWDLALFPDDKTVVVVSENANLVRLTNPLLNVLQGHSDPVIDVTFSPDGEFIASISDDSTLRLWNDQGSPMTTVFHKDFGLGVDWSPDGKEIAAGNWNGLLSWLQVKQLPNKKLPRSTINIQKSIRAHGVGLWRVAFSPNGKFIATIGEDRRAKLWDRQGNLIATFTKHQDVVRGLAISPDSQIIATASYDKTVRLWNTQGKLLASVEDPQYGMSAIAFSNDGEIMVTGNTEGTLQLWQVARSPEKVTLHLLKTVTEHKNEIRKLAFSPDGQLIASASGDSTVKIWHRDGKFLKTFYGHERQVWSVAFSPDGKKIVSSSEDKTVIIWDLDLMFDLDLLAAGCTQIQDYLRTNPHVQESDRNLCQN
ncbi:MAG: WD40 repeat domain-containing protein, partial [Cyanobacteria bacterium J06623_7]